MNCDDSVQGQHFHTQITHMNGCIEFVCEPSTEDGIVGVVEIYYVEGYIFCSCVFLTFEGDWQRYFS